MRSIHTYDAADGMRKRRLYVVRACVHVTISLRCTAGSATADAAAVRCSRDKRQVDVRACWLLRQDRYTRTHTAYTHTTPTCIPLFSRACVRGFRLRFASSSLPSAAVESFCAEHHCQVRRSLLENSFVSHALERTARDAHSSSTHLEKQYTTLQKCNGIWCNRNNSECYLDVTCLDLSHSSRASSSEYI